MSHPSSEKLYQSAKAPTSREISSTELMKTMLICYPHPTKENPLLRYPCLACKNILIPDDFKEYATKTCGWNDLKKIEKVNTRNASYNSGLSQPEPWQWKNRKVWRTQAWMDRRKSCNTDVDFEINTYQGTLSLTRKGFEILCVLKAIKS